VISWRYRAQAHQIVLQVGAEFRIRKNGDLIMDNPELELEREERAADCRAALPLRS